MGFKEFDNHYHELEYTTKLTCNSCIHDAQIGMLQLYKVCSDICKYLQSIPVPTTGNHVDLSWPSESVCESPTFSLTALKQYIIIPI